MFGRRKRTDTTAAIGEFWHWWASARGRVAAAIDDGSAGALADEITDRVKSIHGDLEWELSASQVARHSLVVSSAGDAALRATVARWLASAPPADAVFEYHGSRQPDDNAFTSRIGIAGQELDLTELRFAFSECDDTHALDVAVHHPGFTGMPEGAVRQVTFMALDWALGEDQVELWLGAVEPMVVASAPLRTVDQLRTAVKALAARHADPVYQLLNGQTQQGRPLMAMVQVPLQPVRWPRFDTHIEVALRFPAQPDGQPTDDSLSLLRAVEDHIEAGLGADGVVVGHETTGGARTIHVYGDGATAIVDTLKALVANAPLKATTKVRYDPGFEQVAHLRA